MEIKNNYVRVLVVLLIISFSYFLISGEDERSKSFFLEQEFSGKIIDKFIDKKEHNFKVVVTKNDPYINLSILPAQLFDQIQVNDSISKQKNSLKGFIYRDNKKFITIDYEKWLNQ